MKKPVAIIFTLLLLAGAPARAMDGIAALRFSTPFAVSTAGGVRFGPPDGLTRPTVMAEAGVGGGRLTAGMENTGDLKFGYGLKAAYLRTWLNPLDVDKDQDFIGLEGELSFMRFVVNLGGYRRVGEGDDGWLISAGLGFLL